MSRCESIKGTEKIARRDSEVPLLVSSEEIRELSRWRCPDLLFNLSHTSFNFCSLRRSESIKGMEQVARRDSAISPNDYGKNASAAGRWRPSASIAEDHEEEE